MFLEQKVDFRLKLILTNTFYNSMGYICPIDKVHKKKWTERERRVTEIRKLTVRQ